MIGNFLEYPKYLAPIDDNDRAEDNFEVLGSKNQLQMLAKKMSEIFRHPLTIIDAYRIGTDDDPSKIRVNSEAEFFSLRNSCKLFRHFAGYDKCYDCDHEHALNFMKYLKEHEEIPDFSETTENYIIMEQEDENALGFFCVRGFKRVLYEYRCDILGYRELLIPIYFPPERVKKENRILGILIIGQSVIESEHDTDYIKETKKSFFAKNKSADLFKTELGSDSITEWIIGIDESLSPFEKLLRSPSKNKNENEDSEETTMSFSDMNEYIKFIRKVCEYLHEIEYELLDLYAKKRKEYFRQESIKIVKSFFKEKKLKINNQDISDKQKSYFELETAWDQLLKATGDLKETFGIDEIYVFGDGTSLTMTENQMKSLYSKDKINSDWYYDFSVVDSMDMQNIGVSRSIRMKTIKSISGEKREINCWYNRQHDKYIAIKKIKYKDKKSRKYYYIDKKIIKGLNADGIDKENCFIILFCDIALVFCVKDLKKHKAVYKDLSEEIGKQFSRIHSSIALTTADFMQEKQVKTLRMNRHENAHISERLNDHLEWNFSDNGKTFSAFDIEKRVRIIDDLKDAARLLSNMAENIGIIVGSITKENIRGKVGYVDVSSILIKWQKMFKDKLDKRNLNMSISRNIWVSNEIETIPTLFELMIYNLVDNAVKYAYRGTNIYLSWNKTSEGNVFTIINYGPEIKKEERIFDLYVRGDGADKAQKIEGDGIGLYSVKKICELLGCKVKYTCDWVSDYHLPLIDWYIKLFGQYGKSAELLHYDLNFDAKLKREIVNITEIPRKRVSKQYLNKRIDNKIYKTVFTVTVPDKVKLEGGN